MSELDKRVNHIFDVVHQRRYVLLLIPFSLVYALFSFGTMIYIHGSLADFYRSMYPSYTITYTFLTVIISLLMGLTLTLFVAKLKEVKVKSAGLGASGIIFGALAAGCPGCFFGLFPLFLSLFGITATLAILPFNGLELQAISVPILLFAAWELGKETDVSCRLPKR